MAMLTLAQSSCRQHIATFCIWSAFKVFKLLIMTAILNDY